MSQSVIKGAFNLIKSTSWAVCCGYCFLNFIAEPIVCSGPSMQPTIHQSDVIIAEHISTVFLKRITRGDIIIARSPTDPNMLICKRVSGLSGDRVKYGMFSSLVIPRGHVWLTGDNSNNSTDSRDFGPVPMGLVLGRAVAKIWPPNRIGLFDD